MLKKTEAKRKRTSALLWFVTSRVAHDKRHGLSHAAQACLALEVDGMPCPMNINAKQWFHINFDYIYSKYIEKYPQLSDAARAKNNLSKTQKKSPAPQHRKYGIKAAGIDVISNDFLFSFEWRKLRMQAIKLHGARCMCCGATPTTGAVINVDHVKPRKKYPQLALEITNLQILCHVCNHGKGNWDETDWRKS